MARPGSWITGDKGEEVEMGFSFMGGLKYVISITCHGPWYTSR